MFRLYISLEDVKLAKPKGGGILKSMSGIISRRQVFAGGFTIVELLIVVVIIAILASITTVTYSGIQQRANNAAIIDAASKSLRMIQAYIGANDKYPYTGGSSCITSTSGCQVNSSMIGANATFDNAIATVGTLPRKIPMDSGTNQSGVWYNYGASRTYNGDAQPALLVYWLYGVSQSCGMSDISTGWITGVSSTTGYTGANDGGLSKTLCYVHISGPSA